MTTGSFSSLLPAAGDWMPQVGPTSRPAMLAPLDDYSGPRAFTLSPRDLEPAGTHHAEMRVLSVQDLSPDRAGRIARPALKPLENDVVGTGHGAAARPTLPTDSLDKATPPTVEQEDAQLREQARRFVAQAFYAPMLKQMHEGVFKSDLFSGGRGGEAFSQLFDQHLVDRIARGADPKLVNTLVRKARAARAYARQAPKASEVETSSDRGA